MKLRATMTVVYEYDVVKDHYPDGSTIKEILEIDKKGMEDDPDLFFDSENADIRVRIEEVGGDAWKAGAANFLLEDKKIHAIRYCRNMTKMALLDAKNAVEELQADIESGEWNKIVQDSIDLVDNV